MKRSLLFLSLLAGGLLLAATSPALAPGPGPFAAFLRDLREHLGWLHQQVPPTEVYVQTDKTLYAPGEAIWLTAFAREGTTLAPLTTGDVWVELLDPKGSPSATIRLPLDKNGLAKGDFQLTGAMPGGRYKLRATAGAHHASPRDSTVAVFEKTLTVQAVTLPRVKLTLDFQRKAYGPGDEVEARLKAFSNANQPLAARQLQWTARVADQQVATGTDKVGADGLVTVRFRLPKDLTSADGLLTLSLPHEGLTESISRSVPIVLNRVKLALLPEGGDLVTGLPGRVAVRATNEFGEPADVAGTVVDDQGHRVVTFRTIHDGLGRFDFTPARGRSYRVRLTEPAGTRDSTVAVPAALPGGFSLLVDRQQPGDKTLIATVSATVSEEGLLVGIQRGRVVLEERVRVGWAPRPVRLNIAELPAGVVQLTLFDAKKIARAERLVLVNAHKQLHVAITPEKEHYAPREKVRLTIQATDERGLPATGAALALSVVDDQNLTFADDKQSHLLSWLLAEADLKQPVREPRYYFDPTEKDAPAALDLVLLTHGWRRFTWERINSATKPLPPPPPMPMMMLEDAAMAPAGGAAQNRGGMVKQKALRVQAQAEAAPEAAMAVAPPPVEADGLAVANQAAPAAAAKEEEAGQIGQNVAADVALEVADERQDAPARKRWAGPPMLPRPDEAGYYRAREFAAPVYDKPTPAGTDRTDFRSTLFWKPSLVLDRAGRATVEFYAADAVTSYRAVTEGFSTDGLMGRAESKFFVEPPLAISLKLPAHVVIGDTVGIPIVIANRSGKTLSGPVTITTPSGWRAISPVMPPSLTVAGSAFETRTARYVVGGVDGLAELNVAFGSPDGLRDAVRQTVSVLPQGFPIARAFSGNAAAHVYPLEVKDALPGTLRVTLTAFPSLESDLLKGIAAILQEPSGCFEQTSTTSYPNVLVLDYLRQQRQPDPALVARAEQLLDKGYARLTSFETKEKGYEWFGGTPAHEALTAYGLLQFNDMRRVRPSTVSEAMVDRTHAWMMGRRDGKGGFQKSAQALDQFGRADDDITNAYIVWSMAEAGYRDIGPELDKATERATASGDPYQLALVANALLAYKSEARAAPLLRALYAKQQADGAWTGLKHSVTRSTGEALRIETTSLAIIAALRDARRPAQALQSGVRFLIAARNGQGGFGSTQSTILALKALTAYSSFAQQTAEDGAIAVLVDGREVGHVAYKAGQRDEVKLGDLARFLTAPGTHQLEVRYASGVKHPLPYTLAADWRTLQPPSDARCPVRLTTTLAPGVSQVGQNRRLTAVLQNLDDQQGQPMTMALVGLPAGLAPQPWQLKELQERKVFDFYELREGQLACYFRDMAPGEKVTINLDLKAEVPGTFAAPASVAYLYYTDEHKAWVPGVVGRIQ